MDGNAKDGFTLTVHNPMGAVEVMQTHAPRLDSLNGKVLGELGNGSWEDQATLPAVRAGLKRRFPDLTIIPYTEFPRGTENVDSDATIDLLLKRGVQGLISGNAA
jgi:hypothetical protein